MTQRALVMVAVVLVSGCVSMRKDAPRRPVAPVPTVQEGPQTTQEAQGLLNALMSMSWQSEVPWTLVVLGIGLAALLAYRAGRREKHMMAFARIMVDLCRRVGGRGRGQVCEGRDKATRK